MGRQKGKHWFRHLTLSSQHLVPIPASLGLPNPNLMPLSSNLKPPSLALTLSLSSSHSLHTYIYFSFSFYSSYYTLCMQWSFNLVSLSPPIIHLNSLTSILMPMTLSSLSIKIPTENVPSPKLIMPHKLSFLRSLSFLWRQTIIKMIMIITPNALTSPST